MAKQKFLDKIGLGIVKEIIQEKIAKKVDKVDGKGLSTNDYTTTEKNKLAGIAKKAEVNQNAFSNVKVGSTTIVADSKTDTLTLAAEKGITLTPDATNDKITIAASLKDSDLTISERRVDYRNLSDIEGITSSSSLTDVITAMDICSSVSFWSSSTNYPNIYNEILDGLSDFGFDSVYGNVEIRKTGTVAIVEWQQYQTTKYLYRCVYSTTNNVGWGDWCRCLISTDTMTGATSSVAGKSGLVPVPAAGAQSKYLRGDGTWAVPTNTTYSNFTGATSSAAGAKGLVPAPAKGYQNRYLRGDGTWVALSSSLTSTSTASALNLAGAKDLNDKITGVSDKVTAVINAWNEINTEYVITSTEAIVVKSSAAVAAGGSETVTVSLVTQDDNATGWIAFPITFGWGVPNSISFNSTGTKLTVKLYNTSAGSHSLQVTMRVLRYRAIPSLS